jgi:hypothetical protein
VARGVAVAVDPPVLLELGRALQVVWSDLQLPLRVYKVPTGANGDKHVVAVDQDGAFDGIHTGLKAAERINEGSQREAVVGEIALLIGIPYAVSFSMMSPINGLAGLSGRPFVATRWFLGAESIESGSAPALAAQQHPVEFVKCIAEWIGLGLMLGVRDRHNGNWVCSPDGRQVGMIDNEDVFNGTATASEYAPPLQYVNALDPIRREAAAGSGAHYDAFATGLREFHKKWTSKRADIDMILRRHPWSANYTSPWMALSEDDFVQEVVSQI